MVDMREIEDKLKNLMVTNNWSKTQLKAEVKNRGICLGDGEEYGSALPRILKKNRCLIVSLKMVKKYPLAKMCLVELGKR